jgi:error-prone DNA polymerase
MTFFELAITTNFSFLRGASHADELVLQASALGLKGIGIADRNTLSGVVRAHGAAKETGIQLLVGARLITEDGFEVIAYPRDRAAYGRLSKLLTLGNRRAPKGECYLSLSDIIEYGAGQIFIAVPGPSADPSDIFKTSSKALARAFPEEIYLALAYLHNGEDTVRLAILNDFARGAGLLTLASNDVLYHDPARRILQDVLTCVREHTTIGQAGYLLEANGERHLKPPEEMERLFQDYPEAFARTEEIARAVTFSLDELAYEYPDEVLGTGKSPQDELAHFTWRGAQGRYPDGIPPKICEIVEYELKLIEELNYAPYFLTVFDLVRFARSQGILCQGRGSAANSAVCFMLGVTSVDPTKVDLLFERFISAERNEPPDIDVDFEHERREEVIQYIYKKYGRHRAGIAATVITYRTKSAIRDVGKAMGLSMDAVSALAGTVWGWSSGGVDEAHVREIGLDPDDANLMMAMELARQITGFPRHLSQHVGGFVITRGALSEVVPIANAAMDERTYVEWDKDDLDTLGILKIDVLALGMLTAIAKAFALFKTHYGLTYNLATLPAEDPRTYDMLCQGDSVGTFQVESRAQMTMLPRLKPRNFYDLVIEVAIVRPGPIQGDMVHPYLRRRDGIEPVSFPSRALEEVLGKTLGVPLFQEQAMKIAIVAGGFTPSEADRLRRAMATFRKVGTIHTFGVKLVEGMVERGYEREFAERCFKQIEGFGEYGFPESHAASFALLVYVSAWIKCHYPDVFLACLLNAQPLGFYAPAQLVRDAREHGTEVRTVDINRSSWAALLEPLAHEDGSRTPEGGNGFAVRLGFAQIKGFKEAAAQKLLAARPEAGYDSVINLWRQSGLSPKELERLAEADTFRSIGLDRRDALWAVKALGPDQLPLFSDVRSDGKEAKVLLPSMPLGEHVVHDYAHLRLSLKAHPLSFLRERFTARRIARNEELMTIRENKRINLAGLVLVRQRPGTASGVIFATLEDETGVANVIIWPKVFEKYRQVVLASRVMGVTGRLQREGTVIHVIAEKIEDLSHELSILSSSHHEGVENIANGDAVKHVPRDPIQVGEENRREKAARAAAILPRSRDFH